MPEKTSAAYSLSFNTDGPILRIKLSGQASVNNAAEIARQTHEIIARHPQQLIYIDVREIKGRLKLFEIYEHVSGYAKNAPRRRTAVVELASHRESYSFFETVSINSGLNLRVFTKPGEAEAWLLQT
jgi:hypothetical protein